MTKDRDIVVITGGAIFFLSQAMEMSVFVTNVASMIGIGVAVDYSLFVLARYREEMHAGALPEEARRTAMRTSGLAVTFSGLTVMISLAGLFLVNSTTIRSMATPARPTSPSERGESESSPIWVGRSNATDRPVCPASRRRWKRSLVLLALPKPAYCRIVQSRPRYMVGWTPRVYGHFPGSPRSDA